MEFNSGKEALAFNMPHYVMNLLSLSHIAEKVVQDFLNMRDGEELMKVGPVNVKISFKRERR